MLGAHLKGYNTKRPDEGRGMNGRKPICAFAERVMQTSNAAETSQEKTTKPKAA